MIKLIRITALLIIISLVSTIIGCGEEDVVEGDKTPPTIVSTNPESGAKINTNDTLTIKFNEKMKEVIVSGIDGSVNLGDGINVAWTPTNDMSEGVVSLKINGSDIAGNKLSETAIILTVKYNVIGYWSLVSSNAGMGFHGANMVYDSNRKVTVLFGGRIPNDDQNMGLNTTWEYNGRSWKRIATSHSPDKRYWHAMTYDSQRQLVVLFGGAAFNSGVAKTFSDTWEYDGKDWVQINTFHSPPPRSAAPMVYDRYRKIVILYGGYSGDNETWLYDGKDWIGVQTPTSPSNSGLSAMAFDDVNRKVVLFGGCCNNLDAITWEYDGIKWEKKSINIQPMHRWAHTMVYDSNRKRIVLFGGNVGTDQNDTWEYNGKDWIKIEASSFPSKQEQQSMAYDSDRGRVVMMECNTGNTWEYIGP